MLESSDFDGVEVSDLEKFSNQPPLYGLDIGLQPPSAPDPVLQAKVSTPISKPGSWSLWGSLNPFLSGKGFPILSDLQAQGVSPETLPLIWLRIVDWERLENRDFKSLVIEAATMGQAVLDSLLKQGAEKDGFDLDDLE